MNKLTPCKHLDYAEGKYGPDITLETCTPHYPRVKFWKRGETWTDNGPGQRSVQSGAGRGRWKSYEPLVLSPDAPEVQRSECRIAFFAGAQHLFGSIMGILELEAEPTENDLRRMDAIDRELKAYIEQFKLRTAQPKGNA